jgi:phosphoglycerate dehydrogenase-like enzyme
VLPQAEVLISERTQPVTAEMIAQARRLRLIVRLGAFSYDIDTAAAAARGIRVSVQPITGNILAAEHLHMMILALTRRLGRSLHDANAAAHGQPAHRTDEVTFAFNWQGYTDIGTLFGKQVAIVGMGDIGAELAQRLKPYRLAALLYSKRKPYPPEVEAAFGLTFADLDECLRRADVLVSLLPYTAQTDGLLSAEKLGSLKQGALVVHAGSGSVINEAALAEAVQAGRLGGVALDTYEYEPLQATHPLLPLARDPNANVLLTPHTASAGPSDHTMNFFGETMRYIRGERLQYALPGLP